MKIIHVASEVYPFSKTGGLADVTGSLPLWLASLGNEVIVMSPLYARVRKKYPDLTPTGIKVWVDVPDGLLEFNLYECTIKKVRFLFFRQDQLFNRPGIYNENGKDYPDNHIRFSAFCMACMNHIKHHGLMPDILHAHDWQTALIPVYHKSFFQDIPAKTVFTIHNLSFQGVFFGVTMEAIGLTPAHFSTEGLEFYGHPNLMKGAIVYSDLITTVSPSYAREIQTPACGCQLDGLLRRYHHKLVGILNGIDDHIWDPETDTMIAHHFNKGDLSGKTAQKRSVAALLGFNPEKPLVAMISRLSNQKGVELILEAAGDIGQLDAHFIFLGDGVPEITGQFQKLGHAYTNITVIIGYNEVLSHNLYAAADYYLMPSIFEPCGLSQLIAMRYGALPVVHRTGGLADTVKDVNSGGWGFVFDSADAGSLLHTLKRALGVYRTPAFEKFVKHSLSLDFSWEQSLHKTMEQYQLLLGNSG